MEQEINYGGHSTTPSDYVSKDGDLAVAVNLLNENGSVGVVLPPKVLRQLPSDTAAVYVHDTAKMKHYILVLSNGDIYWADAEGLWGLEDTGYNIQGIEKVVPLGNTLCILSQSGMDYLLWKDGEGEYKRLSPNLPEIKLSFGLQCEFKTWQTSSSIAKNPDRNHNWSMAVMACVNKLMANCTELSKFTMPFFVRYAYKLYDGTHIMTSPPILMVPLKGQPIVFARAWEKDIPTYDPTGRTTGDTTTGYRFDVASYLPACDLDMAVLEVSDDLNDFEDIIKGVDIFVSLPLYTYDQQGEVGRINDDWQETDDYNCGTFFDQGENIGVYKLKSLSGTLNERIELSSQTIANDYAVYSTIDALIVDKQLGMVDHDVPGWPAESDGSDGGFYIQKFMNYIPELINQTSDINPAGRVRLKGKDLQTQINMCSNYYFLKNIGVEELLSWNTRKVVDIDKGCLETLAARTTLVDDSEGLFRKRPEVLYSYNQRLLEGSVWRELYNGSYLTPYTTNRIEVAYSRSDLPVIPTTAIKRIRVIDETGTDSLGFAYALMVYKVRLVQHDDMFKAQEVYVWIKKNGKEYVVKETIGNGGLATMGSFASMTDPTTPEGRGGDITIPWFYYPDADAYCARIRMYREDLQQWFHYKVNLKPHDMLNGAYYFGNFAWQSLNISDPDEYTPTADNWIEQPNKLYTSEVLNPWYFPVEGIVTVGNGEVKALAAATQALSQGQFGQFPLYAFCSDGVWALTVGQTGYFTSSHPVSRDVCTNPDGVTQIDSAVIYPTERGLMLLVGSTNKCFTDELYDKGETTIVNTLTGMDELLTKAELTRAVLPEVSFIEYMKGCKMVYDYVRQRITVYNPSRYPASPGQTVGERMYKYAYVYSLKTNKWGMVESNLEWTTNSYPEALAMTDDKKLVDVSGERGSSAKVKGLLVTRPLKLGDGDIYKSIHTMIQRGMFERGDVGCVLWGSRDLYHWYLVGSSKTHELRMLRGTGYKYYRIGLLVDLPESKSVSRATIELEGRNMNVVR